jgi:PD-(D/E)XK nuclease superfamily
MTLTEHQLADLVVANDDFDALEKALDVFCPFEAVGMVRQEVRHGHFLSYIFNPRRPHGFSDSCIRALMAAAARSNVSDTSGLSLLDIHMMNFDDAMIRREWRKIDILIEVPDQNLVVAIELKIDASEHSGQLARYRQIVETEWPNRRHLFLFLTKRGDEPSEKDGAGWLSVDLESLTNELQSVAAKEIGATDARQLLMAYLAMLGRHHLNDEKLEDLAARLWSKHPAALNFLADRRPDAVGDVFQWLIKAQDGLAEAISVHCGEAVVTDFWRQSAIRFAVPAWDAIPGFLGAEGFYAIESLDTHRTRQSRSRLPKMLFPTWKRRSDNAWKAIPLSTRGGSGRRQKATTNQGMEQAC